MRCDLQEVGFARLQPPQGERQRAILRRTMLLLAYLERVFGPPAPMKPALIGHGRGAGQGRRAAQLLHQDAILGGTGRLHAYRHLVAGPQGSVLARRASRWYLRQECDIQFTLLNGFEGKI